MPETAYRHFQEDIQRAKDLKEHADEQESSILKDDIYRSAWMMAVGSLDAYFCDAYADIIAKVLNAKEKQPDIQISNKIQSISLPVKALLEIHRSSSNWKWRNAARDLIEKDNVLSLVKVKEMFNHIMNADNKILGQNMMEDWLLTKKAKYRLMGISVTSYRKLSVSDKNNRKKAMADKVMTRFASLIQRRHDCIHNCDRPKSSLQKITSNEVGKVIEDIEFVVTNLDGHIDDNLRLYLEEIGCSGTTINQVRA